jgi:hypothetical protein
MELPYFQNSEVPSCAGVQGLSAYLASERYLVLTPAGNHDGPSETALFWRSVVAGTSNFVRTEVSGLSDCLSKRVEGSEMSVV